MFPLKFLIVVFAIFLSLVIIHSYKQKDLEPRISESEERILEETGKIKKSNNPDWWLNSGGIVDIDGQLFSTNIGGLRNDHGWRQQYLKSNPIDTDDGYHPQNIFRLINRKKLKNCSQSVYFYIDSINLSKSENRNESNGIFLLNRYKNGNNLYYAGIRVDGNAIIKKKINGKYYTLAEKNIYNHDSDYDKDKNYNFIPVKEWLGIKSEVRTTNENAVNIKFYIDKGQDGNWELIFDIQDISRNLPRKGYGGIRTDFMDVYFKDYSTFEI